MTQSGVIVGTPLYMAPEQARGNTLDNRADLFSLGSVMYQMLCGRPPFRAPSTFAVLKRVCEDSPRPIQDLNPEVPTSVCKVIDRLLEKDAANRFQSASDLAKALTLCQLKSQNGETVTITRENKTQGTNVNRVRGTSKASKHMLMALVLTFLVIGSIGLGKYVGNGPSTSVATDATKTPTPGDVIGSENQHASAVAYCPTLSDAEFKVVQNVFSGVNGVVKRISDLKDLKRDNQTQAAIILIMDQKAFESLDEYDFRSLQEAKVLGIGYGAAKMFGEMGFENNAGSCAHGFAGIPRIMVQENELVESAKFSSPLFVFDPRVIDDSEHKFHNENIFGVFLGKEKKERISKVEAIAVQTDRPEYATVSRDGNHVLVGINCSPKNWSTKLSELLRSLVAGLDESGCIPLEASTINFDDETQEIEFRVKSFPVVDSKSPRLLCPTSDQLNFKIRSVFPVSADLAKLGIEKWRFVPDESSLATDVSYIASAVAIKPVTPLEDGVYCVYNEPKGNTTPIFAGIFAVSGVCKPEIESVDSSLDSQILSVKIGMRNKGKSTFRKGLLVAVLTSENGSTYGQFQARQNLLLPEIAPGDSHEEIIEWELNKYEGRKFYTHGHINFRYLYDENSLSDFRSETVAITETDDNNKN